MYAAIDNYHGRIENLILGQENRLIQKDWEQLKLLILSIESDGLEQAYEEGKIRGRATASTNAIFAIWSNVSIAIFRLA